MTKKTAAKHILWLLTILCVSVGANAHAQAQETAKKLKVVTTFSILEDMTRTIAQDQIDLQNIVAANVDMHEYRLTPGDVIKVKDADIIVANGLDFEPWLARLIEASEFKGQLVIASQRTNNLPLDKRQAEEQKKHLLEHSEKRPAVSSDFGNFDRQGMDPHAWQNIGNARVYIKNIAKALSRADTANEKIYSRNELGLRNELNDLERWASDQFAAIPESRRKMVSTHDALSYFAQTYRIKYYTPVGFDTSIPPSAKDLAGLIETIKSENIRAIFIENMANSRIIDQISKETGVKSGGVMYTDSLNSVQGDGDTYVSMFRHNVKTIVAAMGGS